MSKKLWQKNQNSENQHAAMVEKFTIGRDAEFDLQLAKYDVLGSIAHCKMLAEVGLISNEESVELLSVLNEILESIENNSFEIDHPTIIVRAEEPVNVAPVKGA
jgi:argininosuccinate lyase